MQRGLVKKNAPPSEKNLKLAADESPSKIVSKDGVADDAKPPAPDPHMVFYSSPSASIKIIKMVIKWSWC